MLQLPIIHSEVLSLTWRTPQPLSWILEAPESTLSFFIAVAGAPYTVNRFPAAARGVVLA